MSQSTRPKPRPRSDFRHFIPLQTRWSDNDQYGHINNPVYNVFFDVIVNNWLMEAAGMRPRVGEWVGLVVDTRVSFFAPASYPEPLEAGMVVGETSTSSVRYEIGIFKAGGETTIAHGHFVQVYVDTATQRPIPLPGPLTAALATLSAAPL